MSIKLRMNDGLLYTLHDYVPLDPGVWATLDSANYRINLREHPDERTRAHSVLHECGHKAMDDLLRLVGLNDAQVEVFNTAATDNLFSILYHAGWLKIPPAPPKPEE